MLKTSVRPFERACLCVRRPARKLCVRVFLAPDYPHVVMPPDVRDSSAYASIRTSAYVSIRHLITQMLYGAGYLCLSFKQRQCVVQLPTCIIPLFLTPDP